MYFEFTAAAMLRERSAASTVYPPAVALTVTAQGLIGAAQFPLDPVGIDKHQEIVALGFNAAMHTQNATANRVQRCGINGQANVVQWPAGLHVSLTLTESEVKRTFGKTAHPGEGCPRRVPHIQRSESFPNTVDRRLAEDHFELEQGRVVILCGAEVVHLDCDMGEGGHVRTLHGDTERCLRIAKDVVRADTQPQDMRIAATALNAVSPKSASIRFERKLKYLRVPPIGFDTQSGPELARREILHEMPDSPLEPALLAWSE